MITKKGKSRNTASAETDSPEGDLKKPKKETSVLSDQIIRMSSETFLTTEFQQRDVEMLRGENSIVIMKNKNIQKTKKQKQSRRVLVYFAIEGKWKEISVDNLG